MPATLDRYLRAALILSAMMASLFSNAHSSKALTWGRSDSALAVSAYSTRGGTSGYTVRVTYPSSSSVRSVTVSIFCEMSGISRCNSLNLTCFFPAFSKV